MRQGFLIFSAVAGLMMSASAAASGLSRDDGIVPGFSVHMSFGGSKQTALARPFLPDSGAALDSSSTAGTSTGISTGTWIVVGVVAAVVVVVLVSQKGGSGGGGNGGSCCGY